MTEITFNCLIIPIEKLMNIPCIKVMQSITIYKTNTYKELKTPEAVLKGNGWQEVDSQAFLELTEEKLLALPYNFLGKPAIKLAKEIKALKEKLKRAFSSYKSLSEVLAKYGIDSNSMDSIPLFSLQTYKIQDSNKHFKHCMAEILVRLKNYGSLVMDSLEAMRNEYIVAILHTAINITRDSTGEELSMRPEYEVIGDKSTGRVDFTIKKAENLICVTENKLKRNLIERFAQNIKQLESSFQTNMRKQKWDDDDDFNYLYDALNKDSVKYQTLHNGAKRVLDVKDRVCAEEEPERKRCMDIRGGTEASGCFTKWSKKGKVIEQPRGKIELEFRDR
ncbi:hypothetical protein C1645_836997 [Glomus cerebriforme]|uniref:Uncharacterized protein n=1 Tax=Glomus cerebriforme TaxID=658196 RepID=A0A397S4Y2_9GLOM|nr:hypothetical protein C1645_836997 [Glomus cerebriforme]